MTAILQVQDLNVEFNLHGGRVRAVNQVSFNLNKGEVLGIVGESGSGKSQTVLAIMGLLANNAKISGSVKFFADSCEYELTQLSLKNLNKLRGNKLAIVFQDPMTSLNPYLTIQAQMSEVLILHKGFSKAKAICESLKMLDFVKIPDAKARIKLYPHELSGGMRQRVMIAMALLCKPELLIADEPTTALDVTVQAQILELIRDLKSEFGMAIIMITHDMGVVANLCDWVNVMYAGNIVESADINDIFYAPKHPYTQALLQSIPSLDKEVATLATIAGDPPNLMDLPVGCAFQNRCLYVHEACKSGTIRVQNLGQNRLAKCNLTME